MRSPDEEVRGAARETRAAQPRPEDASSAAANRIQVTRSVSIPRSETAVIQHFQERMAYGLFVPNVGGGP